MLPHTALAQRADVVVVENFQLLQIIAGGSCATPVVVVKRTGIEQTTGRYQIVRWSNKKQGENTTETKNSS